MTYQDSSGRDVPLGVLTTYDYLIKPMKKMLLQIKDHREGTKYVNKQKYSEYHPDPLSIPIAHGHLREQEKRNMIFR